MKYYNFNKRENSPNSTKGIDQSGNSYYSYKDVNAFFGDKKGNIESIEIKKNINILTVFGYNSKIADCINVGSSIVEGAFSVLISPNDKIVYDFFNKDLNKEKDIYIKIGEDPVSVLSCLKSVSVYSQKVESISGSPDIIRYVYSFVAKDYIDRVNDDKTTEINNNIKNIDTEEDTNINTDNIVYPRKFIISNSIINNEKYNSYISLDISSLLEFDLEQVDIFINDGNDIVSITSSFEKESNKKYNLTSSYMQKSTLDKKYISGYLNISFKNADGKKSNASVDFKAL